MRYQLRLSLLLISLLIVPFVNGQLRGRGLDKYPLMRGFSVSPKVGFNLFYGDLVNERPVNLSFGISSEKELKEYLNARIDFKGGAMSGSQINPDNQLPFSTFKNTYMTFEIGVAFHPLPLFYGFFKQRMFKPYVVGQIGIIAYNATETFGSGNLYTHSDGTPVQEGEIWHTTNGYQIAPIITLGGGLNYYINKQWSASLEFLFSAPATDMLDAHKEWDATGIIQTNNVTSVNDAISTVKTAGAFDPFYTCTLSANYTFAESEFRNQFKYNRKSYIKTRKSMAYKRTKTARFYNKKNRTK